MNLISLWVTSTPSVQRLAYFSTRSKQRKAGAIQVTEEYHQQRPTTSPHAPQRLTI